jgi:CRP-like cAMP-binding protein
VQRTVTHSLVQALRVVPALATLGDNELLKIVGASVNLSWPAGTTVFEQGTPGDALYIVLSGEVSILDVSSGEDVEIARIGPGDSFGEFSLLLDGSHSKNARARRDTELMVLPKESLQELLTANPELDDYLRRQIEQRSPGAPLAALVDAGES